MTRAGERSSDGFISEGEKKARGMTDGAVGSSAWFGERTGATEDRDEPRAFPRSDSRFIRFCGSVTELHSLPAARATPVLWILMCSSRLLIFFFCRTSKMSHGLRRRASCRKTKLGRSPKKRE